MDVQAWWSRVRQGTIVARWTRPVVFHVKRRPAGGSWAFHVKRHQTSAGRLSTTSNHLAGTNPVIGMVKRE